MIAMKLSEDLLRRIDTVDFPSPPAVVLRLSQLLAREDVTGDDIAAAMALDATMAARVLRLANSAAVGGATPVESIPEAVLRVGVNGVRDVVFALAMVGAIRPAHFDYRPYWRHSLAVAHTAQLLQTRSLRLVTPFPETYAAGLLHDIGMLLLDRALGLQYREVLDAARTSGRALVEVEHEMLGTNHGHAGGRILEMWKLPPLLADAARQHHCPWKSNHAVTQLVYLADFICNHQGIHHGTGFFPESCSPQVWEELGLDESTMPEIVEEVQAELVQAEAILRAV